MKIRNILALVALSCMLVLTGCKKETGGIPEHLKIIPANSAMVMTINAKELVKKGGLDDYKDFELYKKAHQELVKYEPEMTKFIDEFLKDTRASGLNLDQIFAYMQRIGEYEEFFALTCGVDNSGKVAKWISKFHELTNEDEYELVKGNGYNAYRLDYSSILIWDDSKAVMLPIRERDEKDFPSFESFLRVDENNCITSNADFMESYNAEKDYTVWVSFKEMAANESEEIFSQLQHATGEDWSKASFNMSLNFTNEQASFSASIMPTSIMENFQKKYPIVKTDFEESILRYFPEEFLFAFKASINIQEYYKAAVEQVTKMTDELEKKQDDDDDDYNYYYHYNPLIDYNYMSQLLSIIDNENVAKIVNSFKGDVVADIFGFQQGMIPQFGIAATINGEQAFNNIIEMLPKNIELTKTGNYYSYSIPYVMTIYAGQNGDAMYITNTKDAIDNFYAQGYKENLSSSNVVSILKNNSIAYSLNLDVSKYPAVITTLLRESMGSMGYSAFSNIIEPFSSLNLIHTDKNSGELNLVLKNNKENSLKVILKAIDSYSTKMMGF